MSSSFPDYVLELLTPIGDVTARKMFGGHGLYCGGVFFAVIAFGELYFKTNEQTKAEYIARGSKPFLPNPKETKSRYYEVPLEVLEDRKLIVAWAKQSIEIAAAEKKPKKPATKRKKS